MSPTLLTSVASTEPHTNQQSIWCYDHDVDVLDAVVLAYQHLIKKHPSLVNKIDMLLLHQPSCPLPDHVSVVHRFPNLEPSVKIMLTVDTQETIIPTLVSVAHQPNHIHTPTLDSVVMASLLKNALYTQPLNKTALITTYKTTHHRLFLFDYDGTLTPIVSNPADAQPTPILLHHLSELSHDPHNTVWIISGRDQAFLDTYLGQIPRLNLSAEHGSFMKKAGRHHDWIDMLKDADMSWKTMAIDIFKRYTDNNPGTVIEQKKSSITWHYRNAKDTKEATLQSHACHQELVKIPGVDILVGKMNLEVRSLLVNKGEVVKRIRQKHTSDFVMCAGDDQTDEDMFRVLKDDSTAYCVSVGPVSKVTLARHSVDQSEDIVDILGQLVQTHSSTL